MNLSSKLANFPQTLRISQEWRRFCLIQALECRRLGMREAKKESLHYAHTSGYPSQSIPPVDAYEDSIPF